MVKDNKKTVQIVFPKVVVAPPPPQVTVTPNAVVVDGSRGDATEEICLLETSSPDPLSPRLRQRQATNTAIATHPYASTLHLRLLAPSSSTPRSITALAVSYV